MSHWVRELVNKFFLKFDLKYVPGLWMWLTFEIQFSFNLSISKFHLCGIFCQFAAFVVQCNWTSAKSETCWCIRCELKTVKSFILQGPFFVLCLVNKFWFPDYVGRGDGETWRDGVFQSWTPVAPAYPGLQGSFTASQGKVIIMARVMFTILRQLPSLSFYLHCSGIHVILY